MNSLIKFFDCGKIDKAKIRPNVVNFIVTKFKYITQNIIPLFQKNPIQGVNAKDFADWCFVADMMKEKKHFTPPPEEGGIRFR